MHARKISNVCGVLRRITDSPLRKGQGSHRKRSGGELKFHEVSTNGSQVAAGSKLIAAIALKTRWSRKTTIDCYPWSICFFHRTARVGCRWSNRWTKLKIAGIWSLWTKLNQVHPHEQTPLHHCVYLQVNEQKWTTLYRGKAKEDFTHPRPLLSSHGSDQQKPSKPYCASSSMFNEIRLLVQREELCIDHFSFAYLWLLRKWMKSGWIESLDEKLPALLAEEPGLQIRIGVEYKLQTFWIFERSPYLELSNLHRA